MSIYKNGKLVAGGSQALPLLSFMWSDHKFNDVSWLRADTFSWQSGAMYQAAYQHLVDDINEMSKWSLWEDDNNNYVFAKKMVPSVGEMTYTNNTLATEVGVITATSLSNGQQTITVNNVVYTQQRTFSIDGQIFETIEGINVIVCVAKDGHKICLTLTYEESDIDAIYNITGAAWYYLLDIGNQRFKLPRINPDLEELAYQISAFGDGDNLRFMSSDGSNKGSYINSHSESLGSGTGWLRTYTSGGSLVNLGNMKLSDAKGQSGIKVEKDTIFGGKKYLYFYVGNFTQTALENTAGITAETLNDKVDKGHEVVEFQAPTASNNHTWYRKYADGWVEQGGVVDTPTADTTYSVSMPIEMSDTNYLPQITSTTGNNYAVIASVYTGNAITTTGFSFRLSHKFNSAGTPTKTVWQVSGMAA